MKKVSIFISACVFLILTATLCFGETKNTLYVSGVDAKELINNVISPNENNVIESIRLNSIGREFQVLDSEKNLKYVLSIAVYPNKDKLIETVNTFRKTISEIWDSVSTENCVVGDIVWKSDYQEVIYSRNNLLVSVYSRNNDFTEIAKKIDNLIVNQKPPFKYSKTPPSAPIPKIPKKIKNNEDNWKALFKNCSGRCDVITNGQVIYRKKTTKETFEPAKKTGKVKLTINIVTDDNLFDTKEVETELVP